VRSLAKYARVSAEALARHQPSATLHGGGKGLLRVRPGSAGRSAPGTNVPCQSSRPKIWKS